MGTTCFFLPVFIYTWLKFPFLKTEVTDLPLFPHLAHVPVHLAKHLLRGRHNSNPDFISLLVVLKTLNVNKFFQLLSVIDKKQVPGS